MNLLRKGAQRILIEGKPLNFPRMRTCEVEEQCVIIGACTATTGYSYTRSYHPRANLIGIASEKRRVSQAEPLYFSL